MKKYAFMLLSFILFAGCADKPYVIVQIADAQMGFMAADVSQREGTDYVNDLTYEVNYLRKAVAQINEIEPDVVVFTGDQVNRPLDTEQWEAFADVIEEIDPDVKLFHIPGNHDVLISEGMVDSTPFTSRYKDDRFIHCDRGVRIVGINSNLIKYDDPQEEAQLLWIKDALRKNDDAEVSILFSHHPFFLNDIEEDDGYFQIQKSKRPAYLDLFTDMDVNALYAGHLHNNSYGSYKGIPVSTTTSVAFQIGDAQPSVRVITVTEGEVKDELLSI